MSSYHSHFEGEVQYFKYDVDSIIDAYSKTGKPFAKERLDAFIAEFKRFRSAGGLYSTTTIHGENVMSNKSIPDGELTMPGGARYTVKNAIGYTDLLSLSNTRNAEDAICPSMNLCPLTIESLQSPAPKPCFNAMTLEAETTKWEGEWTRSPFRHRLTTFLEAHAPSMRKVTKIMCIGLGCFSQGTAPYGRDPKRPYTQYLAALTVHTILKKHGHDPVIYAQDPDYCGAGIALLESRWGIRVLEDPDGIQTIDNNTFVVAVANDIPIKQIAVQYTWEADGKEGVGPAGMLTERIVNDGTTGWRGKEHTVTWERGEDGELVGVSSMDIRKGEAQWSDVSDPFVWEWVRKCREGVLGDWTDEVFGECGIYVREEA
ncbi:hypothetical protein P280DRAFT_153322 [Massarina eburnea CBS 473.64]|uniref:SRR1-like domain-containing protein n=1 Tax=Massarina eburnea CBS 473.64 TaxID=1395130 RepID=A0A6A6RR75_9PLEO|nr:hypothetical protein P280DRAFT_153322 [Massarina eburnea CBS 473.64]